MNKKRLLIILFGMLALSILYAVWRTPRQEHTAASRPGAPIGKKEPKVGEKDSPAAAGDELHVRLELLQRDTKGASRPRRDLFSPLFTIRPQVSKPAAPTPLPVIAAPPPQVVLAPPAPPLPPPVQFEFLGFLQKEVEKTVFISAAGEIFIVKNGDRFGRERQFTVAELTADQLVIRQNDRLQPITLSLKETGNSAFSGGAPPRGALSGSRVLRAPPPRMRPPPPVEDTLEPLPAEEGTEAENPPAAEPPPDAGMLQPVPRSNFNNLFSDDGHRTTTPGRPALDGVPMPPEEVPR